MGESELLCPYCKEIVPYQIMYRYKTRYNDGKEYRYTEHYGICRKCNQEIIVPGLEEFNEKKFDMMIHNKCKYASKCDILFEHKYHPCMYDEKYIYSNCSIYKELYTKE